MAPKMKPWRDAATLILTANLGRSVTSSDSFFPKSTSPAVPSNVNLERGPLSKDGKAQDEEKPPKKFIQMCFDYSTLLLTRNVRRNTFFAGSHVFPGGTIDKADFSPEWMELFGQAGFSHAAEFGPMVSTDRDRAPVLQDKLDSPVPAEVAFRICAIRETFEESGILLLRSIDDCSLHKNLHITSELMDKSGVPFASVLNRIDLNESEVRTWRSLVHQNGCKFLQLCKKFQVLPDIWALAEWSNWLTPSDNKKRFDTMFYICSLDGIPVTKHDEQETIQSQWMTPLDALMKYSNEEIYLPPPQIYELQRMCNYGQQRALHHFLSDRAYHGCQRMLPVRCNSSDGLLSLLPGDQLYPANPVLSHLKPEEILTTKQTMEAVSSSCQRQHRFEFSTVADCRVICNIKLPYGHIGPKDIFEKENISSNL